MVKYVKNSFELKLDSFYVNSNRSSYGIFSFLFNFTKGCEKNIQNFLESLQFKMLLHIHNIGIETSYVFVDLPDYTLYSNSANKFREPLLIILRHHENIQMLMVKIKIQYCDLIYGSKDIYSIMHELVGMIRLFTRSIELPLKFYDESVGFEEFFNMSCRFLKNADILSISTSREEYSNFNLDSELPILFMDENKKKKLFLESPLRNK